MEPRRRKASAPSPRKPTRRKTAGAAPVEEKRTFAERLDDIRSARDRAMQVSEIISSATAITGANSALMAQAIFDELLKPESQRDEARLARYISATLKARDQEIRDKSLALAETKFQFNAARAAFREAGRLKEIAEGPGDEQAKIEKVKLLLFGPEPDAFIVPGEKESE